VSSSQPATEHGRTAREGKRGKKAGKRGNIVFGKGTKCIVKNMTNKKRSQGNIKLILCSLGTCIAFPRQHKTCFMQPWYVIRVLGNIKHHLPGTIVYVCVA
jgi:hypothetical protein